MSIEFKKFNNNPLGKENGDCVIRAISTALGKTWDEVYDDLVIIGRELKAVPNSNFCYESYLKEYELITPKVIKGQKRLTANEMSNGTYILRQANHLSVIKNGVLLDLWDCRKKCVYKYWKIEELEESK